MRSLSLIALLAVSANAALIDGPPFGDRYDKSLSTEIQNFGKNLLVHSLNMRNFYCDRWDDCFPVYLFDFEVTDLVAIKALLTRLYGSEYDRLKLVPDRDENLALELSGIEVEVRDVAHRMTNHWNEILSAIEQTPFMDEQTVDEIKRKQDEVNFYYFHIFGIERGQATLERTRQVYARALDNAASAESLKRARRSFEQSAFPVGPLSTDGGNLGTGNNQVFDKKRVAKQICDVAKRLYVYVYDADPLAPDHLSGCSEDRLSNLSVKTLAVFQFYLQDLFGPALREIVNAPKTSTQERTEKMSMLNNLKNMQERTVDMWMANIEALVPGDYSKDPYQNKRVFAKNADYLFDFCSLNELRLTYNNAMTTMGNAFSVLQSGESNQLVSRHQRFGKSRFLGRNW